jgi:hypothetical protein
VDFDGAYGAQCVDLVQFYLRDVLRLSPLSGNAVDAWRLPLPRGLVRHTNTPINFPAQGDIVVWGQDYASGVGPNGHISVALLADALHLLTFDQNWPAGSPCAFVVHTYSGVLGWLAPPGR